MSFLRYMRADRQTDRHVIAIYMARCLLSTRDTSQTAQQLVTFSRHLTAAPTTETFSHHRYWRHSDADTLTAGVLYELHTIVFFYQYLTVCFK